jgi:hypothetical protein
VHYRLPAAEKVRPPFKSQRIVFLAAALVDTAGQGKLECPQALGGEGEQV